MKQIIVATHHFAGVRHGRLPSVDGHPSSANKNYSLFEAILPFMEHNTKAKPGYTIPNLICPVDPTFDPTKNDGVSSYAANGMAFRKDSSLNATFRDGTSNTLAFAEHYSADCQKDKYLWAETGSGSFSLRRATFADDSYDRVPDPKGIKHPQLTFQVQPSHCIASVAQTPHTGGMIVALFDGSCRILSAGMSRNTYWGAVTPAGGEVLGPDW
ncbi:MAG: DUF1559 domain-containing protein [Gemmataceae bacterium]|nr:DUF1559 domain-containing protein [Gemmataceae bacterium]MCI0740557.1 DUF1559 domain-containing protein [Gemmataceae bacterium]